MKLTILMIAICIFVYVLQIGGIVTNELAFMPAEVASKPHTIITSIFMHGSLRHLLLNMVGLLIFGMIVETEVGVKNWISIYLFSGFIGTLGYMLLSKTMFIPALGASGAIFGLMGAAAILKPMQVIYTPYGPFPMIFAAVIWGITEIISSFAVTGVAHSAHFFGLIGGAAFVFLYRKNIDFKFSVPLIILPFAFILILGLNAPQEIQGFNPLLDNCENIRYIEEINFKYYEFDCNGDILITKAIPYVSKIEPAYYNEYFPSVILSIFHNLKRDDCSISDNNIDIDRNTGLITNWGKICEYEYLNFALICNNVKYEIIQIYTEEIRIQSFNCDDI